MNGKWNMRHNSFNWNTQKYRFMEEVLPPNSVVEINGTTRLTWTVKVDIGSNYFVTWTVDPNRSTDNKICGTIPGTAMYSKGYRFEICQREDLSSDSITSPRVVYGIVSPVTGSSGVGEELGDPGAWEADDGGGGGGPYEHCSE